MTSPINFFVFLFFVLYFFSSTFAFMPLSHEYFCHTRQPRSPSYLVACCAPDAVKSVLSTFHSIQFARALVRAASTDEQKQFALGFGSHLCGDYVGHHKNGFLTPEWDHEIEFATDAFVFHELPFPIPAFSDSLVTFLSHTAASFSQLNETIIKEEVGNFVNFYSLLQNIMPDYTADKYRPQEIDYSFCKDQQWPQVINHFYLASNWTAQTIDYWERVATDFSIPDTNIDATIMKFVDSLYQNHQDTSC
eukprot:TRINITY_DN7944_c0_g1_i1.p1 TRINITY_DN7944_c0_g1~~TRINITY_DN7944_c0_g1_i1.p1  ORF type:complete len:249 (+),score=54.94 TRINITY_DN7944_c0_g1_i1:48-794(+)